MKKNFFTNFGFVSVSKMTEFKDVNFGTKNDKKKMYWTLLVYIFLSIGLFLGKAVNKPLDPVAGINYTVFTFSIIAASFIIGLAILAPLLRVISKFNRGQLSWQHCLTAFSIGFFSNLTFTVLVSNFTKIL